MKVRFLPIILVAITALVAGVAVAEGPGKGKAKGKKQPPKKELYSGDPVKALIITGGFCCYYLYKTFALGSGIQKLANVGGKSNSAKIDLYNDPNWADGYDAAIHNECFAKTTDPDYIRKITQAHREGVPAVVIHCAMHTYRDADH